MGPGSQRSESLPSSRGGNLRGRLPPRPGLGLLRSADRDLKVVCLLRDASSL